MNEALNITITQKKDTLANALQLSSVVIQERPTLLCVRQSYCHEIHHYQTLESCGFLTQIGEYGIYKTTLQRQRLRSHVWSSPNLCY